MSSLKTNALLNIINTVSGILFPIVTFPYAARVLLPEGIGVFNFQLSIVTYIVLLTSLGIPMYAIREVARHRDDIGLRNRTTAEILILSLLLNVAGYVGVWAIGAFVPQVNTNLSIFYVLSLTIVFTTLGVNWFYQAVEDFKFITIRALIFRFLFAVSIFIFVKTPDDLLMYAAAMVGSNVGNNVINFIHLRKFIRLSDIPWRELRIWRHLVPALRIFVLNIVSSIYVHLNVVMLGFMTNDEAVGLFAAGNRLSQLVLMVVSSVSVVILPRCSNLYETGRLEEFAEVCGKSLRVILAMSVPCMLGLMLVAPSVILVFCGAKFAAAASVLCWTSPVILFVGLTTVFGFQVLYPQGREVLVIWSVAGGAVVNCLLNLLLIPTLAEDGAAISTFAAELTVLIIQLILGRRYIPFPIFERSYLRYVAAGLVMAAAVWPLNHFLAGVWPRLGASLAVGVLVYGGVLWLMKDSLLVEMRQYALHLLKRKP